MKSEVTQLQLALDLIQDIKVILLLQTLFTVFYFVWLSYEVMRLDFAMSRSIGAASFHFSNTHPGVFLESKSGEPFSLRYIVMCSAIISVMAYVARYAIPYTYCFLLRVVGTVFAHVMGGFGSGL